MSLRWPAGPVVLFLAFQPFALAQSAGQVAAPQAPFAHFQSLFQNLAQPAVPSDPLELAAVSAQPIGDAAQRAAIISLLANAKSLSNVRAQPYDLKTTFNVTGSSGSDGTWQLENISPGRGLYRWTAQGPGYSVVNLYRNGMLSSNQPDANVPLRLAQVRAAIFYVDSVFGPHASIRTTTANLNGLDLTCALTERITAPKSSTGGRLWNEAEFCVDPKSGLLITYSPVPGVYIQYDYSNAIHFHDKTIPGKFIIAEAGHTVVEAINESVTDPTNLPQSLFDASTLTAVGAGPLEAPPFTMHSREFLVDPSTTPPSVAMQVVIVHAVLTPDGHIAEPEALAASDSSLTQRALDRVKNWENRRMAFNDAQPGASPQSHEVYFTFEYVVPGS